jgi:hypothetical protein
MNSNFHYEQQGIAMTCRSFEEYVSMFLLEESILAKETILDIASGGSSFTAEATSKGCRAKALDPLYTLSKSEMAEHGKQEIEVSTEKLSKMRHLFDWNYYGNLNKHRERRERSLETFLADYERGKEEGRYVKAMLPRTPFEEDSFSLILCSHFLFLYEEQFDYEFHEKAILELIRICSKGGEIKLYPLLNLKAKSYSYLSKLMLTLQNGRSQYEVIVELVDTPFQFLPGATQLLSIKKE